MGTDNKLRTPKQQEDWINEQLGLYSTNSGRRWNKKSDGFKPDAIIRMEAKLSGIIKGGKKQITIKKEDLKLIEQQAIRSQQIPILVGGFKGDDFEEQFGIISWPWLFKLIKLAQKGENNGN